MKRRPELAQVMKLVDDFIALDEPHTTNDVGNLFCRIAAAHHLSNVLAGYTEALALLAGMSTRHVRSEVVDGRLEGIRTVTDSGIAAFKAGAVRIRPLLTLVKSLEESRVCIARSGTPGGRVQDSGTRTTNRNPGTRRSAKATQGRRKAHRR